MPWTMETDTTTYLMNHGDTPFVSMGRSSIPAHFAGSSAVARKSAYVPVWNSWRASSCTVDEVLDSCIAHRAPRSNR